MTETRVDLEKLRESNEGCVSLVTRREITALLDELTEARRTLERIRAHRDDIHEALRGYDEALADQISTLLSDPAPVPPGAAKET